MPTIPRATAARALGAVLALLVLLSLEAHAKVCTDDPRDRFITTSAWRVVKMRTCWAHTLTLKSYSSLHVALEACTSTLACSGVHDLNCMGDHYRLCSRDHNFSVTHEPPAHCVHEKPRQKAKTSVDHIGGKWCSMWCCCEPGWRGALCDDPDECASHPCQNGGVCSESSGDPRVNNYDRKYRCECKGYIGHNCDARLSPVAGHTRCKLQLGADSANASTSTLQAYYEFQAALDLMGMTIQSSDTNFERFCTDAYKMREQGGLCGQRISMYDKRGYLIGSPRVNCKHRPELYALMSMCSTPCMLDPTSACCYVPVEVAWMFP